MALMSSELVAALPAMMTSCTPGAVLSVLVSTSTILTTLPTRTDTIHEIVSYTWDPADYAGNGPVIKTFFVQTQVWRSAPTSTNYEAVTYTECVPTTLSSITTLLPANTTISSSASGSPTTTPLGISPAPQTDGHRTLIISASAGSAFGVLAMAVGFWIWRRIRKRKLELVYHGELIETVASPFPSGRGLHRKLSIGTTINGTDFTSPTLADYVGSMPSISQRNLAVPIMDIQNTVAADLSTGRPSTMSVLLDHILGVNSQYPRSEPISTQSSQILDRYTTNPNSIHSPNTSRVTMHAPLTESYTSRGSSAFLRPNDDPSRARFGEGTHIQSTEHLLLPTVYSPGSVGRIGQFQERGNQKPPSLQTYSQPSLEGHVSLSPSPGRTWTDGRLEHIHEDHPTEFTADLITSSQVAATRLEFYGVHSEAPTATDDGDYETIMYESEYETRAQSVVGRGMDKTDESIFSVDAVLNRISNEPPRMRDRR